MIRSLTQTKTEEQTLRSFQLLAAGRYLLLRDGGGLHPPHPAVQHLRVRHGSDPDQADESQQGVRKEPQHSAGPEGGGQSHRPVGPHLVDGLFLLRTGQSGPDLPVHHF